MTHNCICVLQLHGRLKGNSVTVEEVVGSCLKRANEIKDLNAYINLNSENVEQIEDSKRHFKNGEHCHNIIRYFVVSNIASRNCSKFQEIVVHLWRAFPLL